MCANFDQSRSDNVAAQLKLEMDPDVVTWKDTPSLFPKYDATIVHHNSEGPFVSQAKWSMVPSFEKDPESFLKKYDTFNAKSESIRTSRLYSGAWQKAQRCIVPVNSFTEFRGPKGKKEKLLFKVPGQEFTFLAGLYDQSAAYGKNFTILTCAPSEYFKEFHSRMPVIITDWRKWIAKDLSPEEAFEMCRSFEGALTFSTGSRAL